MTTEVDTEPDHGTDPTETDAIVDAVRTFVRREVVSAEDEIEETDAIPERIRAQAKQMGLFGFAIPAEYGGLGLSMSAEVRLAMEGRVADRAVQIHGGLGYMRSVPVERFYRDARLFRLYEGTSEIQRVIIATQMARGG